MDPVFSTRHGALCQGDCLILLRHLEAESVDLVFADPPFNLGKNYGSDINYSLQGHEYVSWCEHAGDYPAAEVGDPPPLWIANAN